MRYSQRARFHRSDFHALRLRKNTSKIFLSDVGHAGLLRTTVALSSVNFSRVNFILRFGPVRNTFQKIRWEAGCSRRLGMLQKRDGFFRRSLNILSGKSGRRDLDADDENPGLIVYRKSQLITSTVVDEFTPIIHVVKNEEYFGDYLFAHNVANHNELS